ncbi:hypothetical protein BGZ96_001764 [Linnemannia gamsii]|uniref:N-acetyltransferase domain-containing protein n=1 Tax=Linnemannia gamsii TaxID=64522 RepID=A0ABQ7JM08_9FUNG|nr:hypothetical protein BGZ96_001764 [Linnemannia gamsii]
MASMNLRQATADDASVLAELGALTFTHTFGAMYTPKDLQDFLTTTYTVEKHLVPLADSRESFWLVEDESGQAMAFGWAGACHLPVDNLESNAGQIKRIYVHPDHQGKKLGSRLIKRMLDWLGDEGFEHLYIGVWSENYGAHRLYARYGFEKFAEYDFPVGDHVDREFIFKRA